MKRRTRARSSKIDDPENPEWTAEDFRRARPAHEVLPDLVDAYMRSRGRPKLEKPKLQVTLRLDADIVDAFKAEGAGWQSRINAELSRALKRRKKMAA